MRWTRPILFLAGLGFLIFIISEINLSETLHLLSNIGSGVILVLFIYLLAFLVNTFTWQVSLNNIPISPLWIYRLFQMRLVGETFNNITPLAGMGGEVAKAMLLKKYYGISYQDGVASLILAKTINVLALILFLTVGFWFVVNSPDLPPSYKSIAGTGLGALIFGVVIFFLIQRTKVTSVIGKFLSHRKFFSWLTKSLKHVEAVEQRLVVFYTVLRGRFFFAFICASLNWVLGALEVYYTMRLIGHPISFFDAWIIESVAQLVKAGSFFIPASIGLQEGAFLAIGGAITGSPAAGFTSAIVRRFREVVWILWGLIVFYVIKPDVNEHAQ